MSVAKVSTEVLDENGIPTQLECDVEFDETISQVIEIEYISASQGGPIIRPRKPRK